MNYNLNNEFMEKISDLSSKYYSENKKNIFFKKNQKNDCALSITNAVGIDELIVKTIYIIPNTNSVFLDYTIFKTYATAEYYSNILNYIFSLFQECVTKYGVYNTHVNLDTFTISAAERYKNIIELFLENCMNYGCDYSNELNKMYIYNTPNTFKNISPILMPLIDPVVKQKIVFYDKNTSSEILKTLLKN